MSNYSEDEIREMGFLSIGINNSISRKVQFFGIERIEIGNNVRIDDNCVISAGPNGILIDDFVHIGNCVSFGGKGRIVVNKYAGISHKCSLLSSNDDYTGKSMTNPCVGAIDSTLINPSYGDLNIGKHVIIGTGCVILPNCNICEGTSIGALSLVDKPITQMGIYHGNPVKFIRKKSEEFKECEKKLDKILYEKNNIIKSETILDAVIRNLKKLNINYLLGIPGVQNVSLYEHFENTYLITNEQSSGFIAEGLCYSNNSPPCLNLIGGPGITHAMPGIVNCYLNGIPVFILITEKRINTNYKFQIHDVDNEKLLESVTSKTIRLKNEDDLKNIDLIFKDLYEHMIDTMKPVSLIVPTDFYNVKTNVICSTYSSKSIKPINYNYLKYLKHKSNYYLQDMFSNLTKTNSVFVSDSAVSLDEVSYFINNHNDKLIVPYTCRVWGHAISCSIGCILSNMHDYVYCITSYNSLLISNLELLTLNNNNGKLIIFVVDDQMQDYSLHSFANSINFHYRKLNHNDLCDSTFKNHTILHVNIPATSFKIDNSFEEKLNKTNIENMNSFFKNYFIKNLLVTKNSMKNKYFNTFVELFQNDFNLMEINDGQNICFMGDAMHRITNDFDTCLILSNINDVADFFSGIGEAYQDNSNMFCIILEKDENIDITTIIESLSHCYYEVNTINELYINLMKCFDRLNNYNTGPIILKLKYDIFFDDQNIDLQYNENLLNKTLDFNQNYILSNKLSRQIVKDIDTSETTILYIGAGCRNHVNELIQFAEKTDSMVCTTLSGKGIFPENHKNWLWCGMNCGIPDIIEKHIKNCDLMIMIGVQTSELCLGHYTFSSPKKSYIINVDDAVFNRNVNGTPIKCSSYGFLKKMNTMTFENKKNIDFEELKKNHDTINNTYSNSQKICPKKLIRNIQDNVSDETMYLCDSGNGILLTSEHLRLNKNKLMGPFDYSSMGFSIPASIGAYYKNNCEKVICLVGDGAFLMNSSELIYASRNNIPLIIIVLKDNELGMMSNIQKNMKLEKKCTVLKNYNLKEYSDFLGCDFFLLDVEDKFSDFHEILKKELHKPMIVECHIDYSNGFTFSNKIIRKLPVSCKTISRNNIVLDCRKNEIVSKGFNEFWNFINRANTIYNNKVAIKDIHFNISLTYHELYNNVLTLGNFLYLSNCKNIGIFMDNSYFVILTHYAVAMNNKTLINLNTKLKINELNYIIDDSKTDFIITEEKYVPILNELNLNNIKHILIVDKNNKPLKIRNQNVIDFKDIEHFSSNVYFIEKTDSNKIFQIYYTSGTTGNPKGVQLTYDNVLKHFLGVTIEMKITDTDIWGHIAPMYHLVDAFSIYSMLYVGGIQIILKDFNVKSCLSIFESENITVTNLASTMGQLIANYDKANDFKYKIRLLSCGGAPLNNTSILKLKTLFNCEYFSSYGMSECCGKISMAITNEQHSENSIYSSGRCFGLMEIKIVDDYNNVIYDCYENGEILIRGSGLFENYINKENQHDEYFDQNGWFKTGDIGFINEEGFITIVDRKKDMILVGSENVYSVEVEKVLNSHENITMSAIFGMSHNLLGETVVGVVQLKDSSIITTDKDIIEYCKTQLADYKVPSKIYFSEKIEINGNGKINKKNLKQQYSNANNEIENNEIENNEVENNEVENKLLNECYSLVWEEINIETENTNYNIFKNNEIVNYNNNIIYYCNTNTICDIENTFTFIKNIITNKFNKELLFVTLNTDKNPYQKSLIGLFRVFKTEYPSIFITVDIENEQTIEKIKTINFKHYYEFKYNNEKLFINKLKNYELKTLCHVKNDYSKEDCIVITGGTGGLGKNLIKYLHERDAKNIIVLTRSKENIEDENIKYYKININDKEELSEFVNKLKLKFKNCKYLFHLAGSLNDKSIDQLSWKEFENLLEPKVKGTNNLIDVFNNNFKPNRIVLYSSIYALFGYPKLSDYATANYYLNGFINKDNVLVINWGTWDIDGMAANLGNNFRKFWANQGMGYISQNDGLDMMFNLINDFSLSEIGIFPFNRKLFPNNICKPSFLIEEKTIQEEEKRQIELSDSKSETIDNSKKTSINNNSNFLKVLFLHDKNLEDKLIIDENLINNGLSSIDLISLQASLQENKIIVDGDDLYEMSIDDLLTKYENE